MAKGAIYTIGYAKLTPVRLGELMDLLRIGELMDCRSSPRTRVAGFGNRQLATFFGEQRYSWRGDKMGGRAPVDPVFLRSLAKASEEERFMLMCMEESPGDCHRHYTIAMPLVAMGARVFHVYRDQVIDARELQDTINSESEEYDCEDLDSHARAALKGK